MSIRSKLAWTFILLLIFGITAISSYSILFIRNYMLEEGVEQIQKDTQWLAVTIENLSAGDNFEQAFREAAKTSGYQLALYDRDGVLFSTYPDTGFTDLSQYLRHELQTTLEACNKIPLVQNESDNTKLISYSYLPHSNNAAQYIRVSQFKDQIYAPIKTIRWIIYYGMFISIALVIIVSIWIARYLTKPITEIKNVAREIAGGDVDKQIDLNRNDEFGTLAESLNQMASKLRKDTQKIRKSALKQQQFFADITHEIRNPLHTISGALELLEMDNLPEEQRKKYLKNAQKQTERIGRLFKDLMTLQRYDSDEYFIEEKVFDLSEIGHHIQELYDDKAVDKSVNLEVDTHSCKVIGDPGKIEQVVDNLISNAIKYTNEGSIALSYRASNGEVKVQVKDTGIGISQEHLDRLFDRFYRTDKARSRDKGGTGLGLAVVKSILNAHGRDIHVNSKVEKGSTFWFTLPSS